MWYVEDKKRTGKVDNMKRIAILTGASSGMGRELALQLAQWETFDELWVIARR